MNILGVDPGYRNLGLSVVRVSDDGTEVEVLHSENMSVGKATAPMMFTKFLWPALSRLDKDYGIDAVASEPPPFIMGQIQTTAFLWAVSSIIVTWAHVQEIPFKHASPISLKKAVCRILKRKWSRKTIPKKSEVRLAVEQVLGQKGGHTSHENDATLAALTMFSKAIPTEVP